MRYLDQELLDGDDTVRFEVQPQGNDVPVPGNPYGVSLRDYNMAVVGLRVEVGTREELAALRSPKSLHYPGLVVIRGCMVVAGVDLGELPFDVGGLPWAGTGPYRSSPPSPFPTYLYNPPRQNLTFAMRGELPVPVAIRFWWRRLDQLVGASG